ncbi:MAG: OmpA family protein [Marinoscillum sp.]
MRSIIYILLTTIAFTGLSQKTIFRDDFRDNRNDWSIAAKDEYAAYIQDGKYVISKKTKSGGWLFYKKVYTEYDSDYRLEIEAKQTSGVDNNGYGFIFATESIDNANFFMITSNGHYRIASYNNGPYKAITEWTKSDAVLKMNEINRLIIERKGDQIHFYVNKTKVHSLKASEIEVFGSRVGFILYDEMRVEFDYVEVKQDYKKINLVPGVDTIQVVREPLGTEVNSPYTEKAPVISADGRTLYFNRDNHPENIVNRNRSDIWYSKYEDGKWQTAQQFPRPVNNEGHNFVVSVTPDNNALLVGNTYHADGSSNSSGFSYTTKGTNGWEVPKTVTVKEYQNHNSYTESCLSSSRKVLLSSVERDDHRGSKDIYVSFLESDSTWSVPKNIGMTVNTDEDEDSPFLAADDATLYFSTSGHPGFGNNDIFVTRRLDDTWLNWSRPQNLGPHINTPNWDAYYTIPASGAFAYVVSNSLYEGDLDIYRIKIPQAAKPKAVTLVQGKVLNSKTNEPIKANITYYDLDSDKEIGRASSLEADGSFNIVLTSGKSYSFLAAKDNYITVSENVTIAESDDYQEIERNLYLAPIEVGQTVLINNIFFDTGKASLRETSFADLNRLVGLLNKYPNMKIEINGHTDNIGSESTNQVLSQSRAQSVLDYLSGQSVGTDRLVSKGYGEAKPIATNDSEEGRQRNRRVEFTIVSM